MRFRGDLRCLHCARSVGTLEWTEESPTLATQRALRRDRWPRCPHCAGPVYLEEVVRVRVDPLIAFEKPRRGRPRKHPLPAAPEALAQAS